jgi:hypothetical protein
LIIINRKSITASFSGEVTITDLIGSTYLRYNDKSLMAYYGEQKRLDNKLVIKKVTPKRGNEQIYASMLR